MEDGLRRGEVEMRDVGVGNGKKGGGGEIGETGRGDVRGEGGVAKEVEMRDI